MVYLNRGMRETSVKHNGITRFFGKVKMELALYYQSALKHTVACDKSFFQNTASVIRFKVEVSVHTTGGLHAQGTKTICFYTPGGHKDTTNTR